MVLRLLSKMTARHGGVLWHGYNSKKSFNWYQFQEEKYKKDSVRRLKQEQSSSKKFQKFINWKKVIIWYSRAYKILQEVSSVQGTVNRSKIGDI